MRLAITIDITKTGVEFPVVRVHGSGGKETKHELLNKIRFDLSMLHNTIKEYEKKKKD